MFYSKGERDKNNEIGLKEGKVIKIETTVLHSRAAPSLCIYLPNGNIAMLDPSSVNAPSSSSAPK